MSEYKRPIFQVLINRLHETRRFIQVLSGPRQVGKTTLIRQILDALPCPSHYASADEPGLQGTYWIEQQWDIARLRLKQSGNSSALLVLDEVQKIPYWSTVVKRLWDADSADKIPLQVVLLGSSPLLMQQGLIESLAGRFELIPMTHWSYREMQEAFGWDVEQYIYFGGYPGAASLINEEARWARYIIDSIIETTLSRDILLMTRVDKPALLRRLFDLGSHYSGQIISFQKMLGQLQDLGNTTTLAHYLELLFGAGMLAGLSKYSGKVVRQRASSPKLQILNTALMSASLHLSFAAARKNHEIWGRLVESSIGAYLLNSAMGKNIQVFYWRERNKEVDFVLSKGKECVAIEVKSQLKKEVFPGMEEFANNFKPRRLLHVGGQGLPLQEFLTLPIEEIF